MSQNIFLLSNFSYSLKNKMRQEQEREKDLYEAKIEVLLGPVSRIVSTRFRSYCDSTGQNHVVFYAYDVFILNVVWCSNRGNYFGIVKVCFSDSCKNNLIVFHDAL